MYGYYYKYNGGGNGSLSSSLSHNASFVYHSKDYAHESTAFDLNDITNDKTFEFWVTLGDENTATYKTLLSAWNNANGERSFIIWVTTSNEIEYLQSSTGNGLDVRVKTTTTLTNTWTKVRVIIDVDAGTATDVVTIEFDDVAQATTAVNDTGNYSMYAGTRNLTLGGSYTGATLGRFWRGIINQCNIYNGSNEKIFEADFDGATFSTSYTIPDNINANDFTQIGTAEAQRTSIKNDALSPTGVSYGITDFVLDGSGFYQYDNQPSASFAFNTTDLTFTLSHTTGTDPDRNSCEVLSKGSYDISSQELWVRFNAYDWNASSDPMSHGGFSIIADKNDLTFAIVSHRVLNASALGEYRVVIADNGIQLDNEPGIAKGKDVFIKVDGTDVSFYYNNVGVLTQMWTTQTLDMGESVRIKAHARDYNAYADPDTYETTGIKVYRTTPTDL